MVGIATLGGTADGDAGVDGEDVDVANTVVDGVSVGEGDGKAVDGDPVGDGVGDMLVEILVGRVGAVGEHAASHPATAETCGHGPPAHPGQTSHAIKPLLGSVQFGSNPTFPGVQPAKLLFWCMSAWQNPWLAPLVRSESIPKNDCQYQCSRVASPSFTIIHIRYAHGSGLHSRQGSRPYLQLKCDIHKVMIMQFKKTEGGCGRRGGGRQRTGRTVAIA
jgi:hypothetical protein